MGACYADATQNNQNNKARPTELKTLYQNNPELIRTIVTLYPNCYEDILQIYEVLGLTPLLNHYLSNAKPDTTLKILNQTLQNILLRPKNLERFQLNDVSYLQLIQERIQNAYHKANMKYQHAINTEKLRALLLKPSLWDEPLKNKYQKYDAVIIMGSTYQNYLNRQNFFLELLHAHEIAIHLNQEDLFPVYLLGGDRPLDPKMDKPAIKILEENKMTLNEQAMMDWLFDKAAQNEANQKLPLKRISTNSPKEEQKRPTTAGTLDSLIPLLKDEHRILVISSAPFIRYQKLVTQRQFLSKGVNIDIVATGPNLTYELKTHPELADKALIAICLDNLAREVFEMNRIEELLPSYQ